MTKDAPQKPRVQKLVRPAPIGLFLHTKRDGSDGHGWIDRQGMIIGEDGSKFLVQLFSWLTGEQTIVVPMEKDFVYSGDHCVLYSTQEAWNAAADKVNRLVTARE